MASASDATMLSETKIRRQLGDRRGLADAGRSNERHRTPLPRRCGDRTTGGNLPGQEVDECRTLLGRGGLGLVERLTDQVDDLAGSGRRIDEARG